MKKILLLLALITYQSYSQNTHTDTFMLPYDFVDQKPMFSQCQDTLNERQHHCFKSQLDQHVAKHFHYPEPAVEMGITGKVLLYIRINTNGSTTVLRTRGTDKFLEKEAERIIKKLPPFIPAQHVGKPVAVLYKYCIRFKLID